MKQQSGTGGPLEPDILNGWEQGHEKRAYNPVFRVRILNFDDFIGIIQNHATSRVSAQIFVQT